MAQSDSAMRLQNILPGLFKVTGMPKVDPTFFGAKSYSIFRPYLCDDANDLFTVEPTGKDIVLARPTLDEFVDSVYGKALDIDPTATEAFNTGIDPDADLGDSFTLTFLLNPSWDTQPTATSKFYPFYHPGANTPRLGYVENTGTVEAAGWWGNVSAAPVSLSYALGWAPHGIFAVSLVCDNAANKTYLYVNGVLRATLNESISANSSGTLRCHRTNTQAGVTGTSKLEGYFLHDKALPAADVTTLHKMFTTGFTTDSRLTRTFLAMAMCFAEVEAVAFRFAEFRRLEEATGGALVNIGKDVGIRKKPGELEDALRQRIKNRYLEFFSEATPNQLILVASETTGLDPSEITLKLNEDSTGARKPAYFFIQLPPGSDALLTDLSNALEAAKAAGVEHATGVLGSFGWDVAESGWDTGSWNYVT